MELGPNNPFSPLKTFLWVDERTFVTPKVEKLAHLLCKAKLLQFITLYCIFVCLGERVLKEFNSQLIQIMFQVSCNWGFK